MGLKALIYFEVITTLALIIGLSAINITKAGVGVRVPSDQVATVTVPQKQTPSDLILHVFPENIAKSVAEGQVLLTEREQVGKEIHEGVKRLEKSQGIAQDKQPGPGRFYVRAAAEGTEKIAQREQLPR